MNKPDQIIAELLDDDSDYFDAEQAKEVSDKPSVETLLQQVGFSPDGTGWFKSAGDQGVTVNQSTRSPAEYHVGYYRKSDSDYWIRVFDEYTDENGIIQLLDNSGELPVAEGLEDEDDFDTKDLTPQATDKIEIIGLINSGVLTTDGGVKRTNHHYVHERSTTFTLNSEFYWDSEPTLEQKNFEEIVEKALNELEEGINKEMVGWNRKIYRELESAWEWSISDEVVAEDIMANEHTYDEDGYDGGDLTYDQLSPEAQEKARESWVKAAQEIGDIFWSEPVFAEWRWLLKNKGFNGVEISFRGFSSQGDGASFTADTFDLKQYLTGPDPLSVPESDREGIYESAEEDEAEDAKEVSDLNQPERIRNLTHIETEAQYAEYELRVKEFFANHHIKYVSPEYDDDGNAAEGFSWRPCDICDRGLGGNRTKMSSYNQDTKEIHTYSACDDCVYYTEYGRLDDMTMMDLKKDEETNESMEDDDFQTDIEDVVEAPPERTFQVLSSHGTLTALVDTGRVSAAHINDSEDEDGKNLANIMRFDVEEWRKHYNYEAITPDSAIDILDLGYWLKDDAYEPPSEEWRQDYTREREQAQMNPEPEGN